MKNKKIKYGIQGGLGSFNEQALSYYTSKYNICNYETKYLYTTENVLKELDSGNIDYGQFAIYNTAGRLVEESVKAMGKYKFKVVKDFQIKITHHLMKRKEVSIDEIKTIMAHPQVFKQCNNKLKGKYSYLKKNVGKRELIDHAMVAKYLSESKISQQIAVLGPKVLSEIYDLEVIEDNLQNDENNYTTFLIVKIN